jgi:hypothetical protein
MENKTSTLALKTAINEIKNSSPSISNIFVLDKNRQLLTRDQNTSELVIDETVDALSTLIEKASITGGIESLTVHGTERKINFTNYDNSYFVTVGTKQTDEKNITNLTRVLVPTMFKLSQQNITLQKETEKTISPRITPMQTLQVNLKPSVPKFSPSEFIVQDLGGFGIIAGSVQKIRVDRALIGQWSEFYGDKKIKEAIVESVTTKKKQQCPFEPIKDSKFEGIGVVQLSEKLKTNLAIKRGDKVTIIPVFEEAN